VPGERGPGPRQRLEYVESLDRKAKDPSLSSLCCSPNAAARLLFLYQLQQLWLADPTVSDALEPLITALYGAPSPAPEQPWRTVNPIAFPLAPLLAVRLEGDELDVENGGARRSASR
jgi:hypothetical protein